MQKLKKMVAYADTHFEKPFLILGLVAMILIICYQTLYRYLITFLIQFVGDPSNAWMIAPFCDPLALKNTISQYVGLSVWSEETARYIFIWISYLAIPLAIRERSNIRVDIIYDRLSNRLQAASWVVVDLCLLILSGFMLFKGFEHVRMQIEIPQTTAALQIPYFIPYLILPVGFGLMVLRALEDLCAQVYRIRATDSLLAVLFTVFLFSPVFLFEQLNAIMLLFGYFIVLLFIGVPIAFSLGIASLMTVLGANTLPVDYLASVAFTSIDSFPIMAIPFFIAAGIFMGAGGLSHRLLALADEVVGGLSGGIALASIATCMFFAAISGSGPATVAAIGTLTIPAMTERGYDKMFAAAVVASAGAIGVMIPPSNPFVVYGVAGQASVGKLFLAGITPGILTGLVLMLVAYCIAKKNGWRGAPRQRNLKTLGKAVWVAKAIKRILNRHGLRHVPVVANRMVYREGAYRLEFPYGREGCASGVCKCGVAEAVSGDGKTLLIGDGLSDCCLARSASFTLARQGKALHRRCAAEGYPYFTYLDFFDILEAFGAPLPKPIAAPAAAPAA